MAPVSVKSGKGNGGGCLILFGLVFAGFGGLFAFFIGKQIAAEVATRQWPEVLCRVERCEVADRETNGNAFTISHADGHR